MMTLNYTALGIAILWPQDLDPEEALRTAGIRNPEAGVRRSISRSDEQAARMLALHEEGLTWVQIGMAFNKSKRAAFMQVKRYQQRRMNNGN